MRSEGPHCTRELRNIWNYERQSSSAVVSPEPSRSCLTQNTHKAIDNVLSTVDTYAPMDDGWVLKEMGRGKVQLKRIENPTNRQVTFSKRRNGLLKKAFELSILCDAEVALLIFSSSGKVYQFASHDMDRTVAKYRREVGLPDSSNPQFRTMEFWRSEIDELNRSINTLEARLKHLSGEDILALGMRDLKQLERQLKIGVERVRSRKRRIVSDHATLLKRRHKQLQEENSRLHKRLKELQDGNISSGLVGENACTMFHQRIVHEEDFHNETGLPL